MTLSSRAAQLFLGALAVVAVAEAAPAKAALDGARAAGGDTTRLVSEKGRPLRGPLGSVVRRSLVPLVPGTVTIQRRACPFRRGVAGCVHSRRPRTIWVRRGLSGSRLRALVLHELGHLFDFRVLNREDRRSFKEIIGENRGWWEGAPPPAELFAEAYSFCARSRSVHSIGARANYGYDPSPEQHRRACELIRAAAGPGQPPQREPQAPTVVPEPAPSAQPPAQPAPGPPPPRQPAQPNALEQLLDALL